MNRLNRKVSFTLLGAACAMAGMQAASGAASEADAATAIASRQAIFQQVRELNEPLGKMLKRQIPVDAAVIATNGAKIQALAGQIPEAFKVDTRGATGTKTAALDGIWNSQADFKAKADALATAAAELITAGNSGNADTTQRALISLGRTCGSCHDAYRAKTE